MLEILAPAGNFSCANTAINNGANAVYLGYRNFSARQNAENFDMESLRAVLLKAHCCGVKVYLAMNTLVKDEEIEAFLDTISTIWAMGVDAVILQDPLLGKALKEKYPKMVLHLSTQAGVCNVNGAQFAKECGFSRVILARETPFEEIQKITKIIETEVFVQGALCTCFSGQCYFSSFAGGNSGNRGRCKQPCRKRYYYNRGGERAFSYALSLSDLSVGEDIKKYIDAGVLSFKIEGRMRREEYVASAVRYYRAILDGRSDTSQALSDLKRTYNRGNYTKGLAFGQDKRFLSTAIQGHIGEKVGSIKVINGKYFVESGFSPRKGDAFKILRDGLEVGGAFFVKNERRGFILSSSARLKNGDGVFVTTDTEVNERVIASEKKGKINIWLTFCEGERACAVGGGVRVFSDEPLETASSAPLTREEIEHCFSKTDGLALEIGFEDILLRGDVFVPKSKLNAFRRKFFAQLEEKLLGKRDKLPKFSLDLPIFSGENGKIAVISDNFSGVQADIAIYKPFEYSTAPDDSFVRGNFEKYAYYPAYALSDDEEKILEICKRYRLDGVYVENYAGLIFARENGLKVFAGTGLNLFNRIAISKLLEREEVSYYALSKEGTEKEIQPLITDKAFILSVGDLKIMDLCYCPFGKSCAKCDKKKIYTLTDENLREFPVRRYVAGNGECRFEVYNCAKLISENSLPLGRIIDLSLEENKKEVVSACNNITLQKKIFKQYTSGHFNKSVF